VIGKISDMATSAVVLRRDTLEATGLSYPIGSVTDRPWEERNPRRWSVVEPQQTWPVG